MHKGTNLSTYNNSWYKPGPSWKRFLWYFVNYIIFNSSLFPFYKLKVSLLKAFGAKVGKNVFVKPFVNIKYPWFLEIGNNVWIGEQVWIDNLATVRIGNNVCISQGSMLLTGNHNFSRSSFDLIVKEIELEDGVWIGARATVCGGAICKSHAVLTVNSVAIGELAAFGIFQGNPAVRIKERVIN